MMLRSTQEPGRQLDDGKMFTTLVSELKDAINKQPTQYERSTMLTGSMADSNNPIGSHIAAHTSLTEIKQEFDLFWRNDVPAKKMNLGLGSIDQETTDLKALQAIQAPETLEAFAEAADDAEYWNVSN
ncbi:MAG: hypothetical protein Q9188_006646 [Gyalolechia gomerana]